MPKKKQKKNSGIFISHATEDKAIAEAWRELIKTITYGAEDPWYSSDHRAKGGIGTGEWRKQIYEALSASSTILVILTPDANDRLWLGYEGGFAHGQHKKVVPVACFMKKTEVHSVFKEHQAYQGADATSVLDLCGKLVSEHLNMEVPKESQATWAAPVEKYLEVIEAERDNSFSRLLFRDHFHSSDQARRLKGTWYAKWTQIHDDGTEDVFEVDELHVWTTDLRIRMVGVKNAKGGVEDLEGTGNYPMEGVVSSRGDIATSYWSYGNIPICGTALFKPKGTSGNIFVGTWQGFTARHLDDDPSFVNGRVVMARDEETTRNYWSELSQGS